MSTIKKIGIAGSGAMGSGIAQVASMAGCTVKLYDKFPASLQRGETKLKALMTKLVGKGKFSQERANEIVGNIEFVSDLAAFAECELIIEAIVEDIEVKKSLFREIEDLVSEDCILATNTSSLSVSAIAAACNLPKRVLGIHFFNPAALMKLVEIIPAIQTAETVVLASKALIKSWGKLVVLTKDTPGFIVNRVARPFYGEAIRILEEGIADVPTIDWAMKELGGFRMGPFELTDYIGHDVNYAVTESVFKAFYWDRRYMPSFTQRNLVNAGYLGRKTGRGFYNYLTNQNPAPSEDKVLGQKILDRILIMLINEAADALFWKVASKEDLDIAMTKGVNYPKGLLAWADEIGIATCVNRMDALFEEFHDTRYRCSPLLRKMAKEGRRFGISNIES